MLNKNDLTKNNQVQVNKNNENTHKISEDKNEKNNNNNSKVENNQNYEINKNIEEDKPKIYKYYSSKKIRNHLPYINSPQKLNYLSKQQISLNDIENNNIISIVLPHIGKIKKNKKIKYETSKKIQKINKEK